MDTVQASVHVQYALPGASVVVVEVNVLVAGGILNEESTTALFLQDVREKLARNHRVA